MKPAVNSNILVDVKDLKMYFPVTGKGILRQKIADVKAVDGVNFQIKKGETLGLVGESGCGKTTVGRCILRLYKPTAGQIFFEGRNIVSRMSGAEIKMLRRKISFIFQDPYGSLNPRHSAGSIVGEALTTHKLVNSRREYEEKVDELFCMVGLDPNMKRRYPHEFSGGQRQRIGIARAIVSKPKMIVCDEPVSALDVSIQAQIINLLKELQENTEGLTYLFVSHDLSVVRHVSDRIAVMYLGRIMEIADAEILYENPLHPYTRALLSAVPVPDPFVEKNRERIVLGGEVPSPLNPPSGCPFHPRCTEATAECRRTAPELLDMGDGHFAACLKIL